jgi:hypothetical protein
MLRARPILENKFWLIETLDGVRKGTITAHGTHVRVTLDGNTQTYESFEKACWELGMSTNEVIADDPEVEVSESSESLSEEVMGYPTRCQAFNPTWDIKRKIPIFTKTSKSRTLHAAGYYIIHFENGWANSFCPKVSTLDANEYQGPFKDKLEMRERLRLAHASNVN